LLKRKTGCEYENHKFYVLQVLTNNETLMQLLQCKVCNKKFFGYGGYYGQPKWVHEMPEKQNPLVQASFQ